MPQGVHGAFELAYEYPVETKKWFDTSKIVIVLAVKDEQQLIQLQTQLTKDKIKHSVFYEPDRKNELTSIAVVPGEDVKKYCSSLPLAGKVKIKVQ